MPFHVHRQLPCPLENAGESTHHFTLWQAPPTNPDRHDRADRFGLSSVRPAVL